jgi:hypothetical protein
LAEVRYVGSWVRKISAATVFSLTWEPPVLLYAATSFSIAAFACSLERLDWSATSPVAALPLPGLFDDVAHPGTRVAAPSSPSPLRNVRRSAAKVMPELLRSARPAMPVE